MATQQTQKQPTTLPQAQKRPYQAPRLSVHGTVTEITQAKFGARLLGPGYLTQD